MGEYSARSQGRLVIRKALLSLAAFVFLTGSSPSQTGHVPDRVPPKRSSQIHDGFGINSDMPRDPYLPWNRWWWTRMFDAGFKWIRIGQYENSSDRTSWDWIEQKRGVFASSPNWKTMLTRSWTMASRSRCSCSTGMSCTLRQAASFRT